MEEELPRLPLLCEAQEPSWRRGLTGVVHQVWDLLTRAQPEEIEAGLDAVDQFVKN